MATGLLVADTTWRRMGGIMLLYLAAGCSGNSPQPVIGKVTYADGSPMLGGGQVTFEPMDPSNKASARGIINKEDGRFQMGTFEDTDGVPEGRYHVAVMPTPPRNINNIPPGWPPLQKKYMNPKTSELEFTVTRGRNEYKLVVEK